MYAFTWGWELLFASLREIASLLRYDWKRAPLLQSYVQVIHGQCIYQEVPLFLTEKKHSTLIRIKPKKKEFRTWNTDIQGLKFAQWRKITFRGPSIIPFKHRKWNTVEPKPPIEPSSTVIRISCSLANLLMRFASNGLQHLASATITKIFWDLRMFAASTHCWTIEPYPRRATLWHFVNILPFPIKATIKDIACHFQLGSHFVFTY